MDGLISARALYSDMERTGYFTSENDMVQQLYQNQLWSQKSNYVEVPTDCPQRDERMGYTGDGQVFAQTGAFNFDTRLFWKKFLRDIRFSQMDNTEGYVDATVPAQGPSGIGMLNMLGWGNCNTIVPDMLFWQYGDDSFLRQQYESMKTFVECEIRHMGSQPGTEDLWIGPNLGDWLALGKDIRYMAMHNGPVSNSFIVNDLRILSKTARHFGYTDDAERYAAQFNKTRDAYIRTFVQEDGTMKDDYQGAYVMALAYVLEKGELWEKVYAHLVNKLRPEGIGTGFFATRHLLPLLAEHGDEKLAYDLLLTEECPGWMYQIRRGATTIWERWDSLCPDGTVNESKMSDDNMVSFNHYAFGSVGEFYYRNILGIQPVEPGYKRIRVAPSLDERLGAVSGSYQSVAGEICVSWKMESSRWNISLKTPVEAELILPNGEPRILSAGSYQFESGGV